MSKYKIKIITLAVGALVFTLAGCYKTTTLLIDNTPEVTTAVSFSKDLVPILSSSCAKSGCHNGSIAPNLTEANAFNSLVNGNFVDVSNPANSNVYQWLTGKRAAAMPLGASNNPSNINGLMLAWIKQGAKNN